MKKNYIKMLGISLLSLLTTNGFGQSYSAWGVAPNGGDYDTLTKVSDTLRYSFQNLPDGAWGNATLRVYFEGDFGDGSEYLWFEDESQNNWGQTLSTGNDCMPEDSVDIIFPASELVLMNSDQLVLVELISTSAVDLFCVNNRARVKLIYNYCAFGTPNQIAELSITDTLVCPLSGPYVLTGVPMNGTYSGINVTGNQFTPQGLGIGKYVLSYEATDNIGCITSDELEVTVLYSPEIADSFLFCPGDQAIINTGSTEYVWSADNSFSQIYDTTSNFVGPNIFQATDYYLATVNSASDFNILNMNVTDSAVVDHDAYTGDDRGGIAVTQSYIYVVGDNNTARYDLDLTNPVSFMVNDGLFSDLNNGTLYTIHDGTSFPSNYPTNYSFSEIRGLNSDLSENGVVISLSQVIPMEDNFRENGIFAGAGYLVIYSGLTERWYSVDLSSGQVTDLGIDNTPSFYNSENWSIWGVAEFDGANFYALYRSATGSEITRKNLSTYATSTAFTFTNISDLASFTYSPWNNRWYFHYEGSGQFGGSTETLGYASGVHTITTNPGVLSCYSKTTAYVNQISLGPDTTVCEEQTPHILFGGVGYSSYSWNGDNSNYNTFNVTQTGDYVLEVVDGDNCLLTDTVNVLVESCLGLDEQKMFDQVSIFPNPTSGAFEVQISSIDEKEMSFELLDSKGTILETEKRILSSGVNKISFDLNSVSPGIYFLRLQGSEEQQSFKVIKE